MVGCVFVQLKPCFLWCHVNKEKKNLFWIVSVPMWTGLEILKYNDWMSLKCHVIIFFLLQCKSSQHSEFICNDALPPLQISPFPGGLIYVKSQTSPMAVLKCSEWRLCAPGLCQRHNPRCNCSLWESTSQWNHLQVHGAVSEEWVDFLGIGCRGWVGVGGPLQSSFSREASN